MKYMEQVSAFVSHGSLFEVAKCRVLEAFEIASVEFPHQEGVVGSTQCLLWTQDAPISKLPELWHTFPIPPLLR
eukprot:CAMPEP_0194767280 /NCGR_PEP_ID=MMETSP0323_2-20130528/35253_1 /TAXON_ID=2866 ORGANISM="Crypthecodinium cohnii, Strain Seligo" /NCGR_SAMPLE_ID=MMETSP0323_2 /ASSEMBLY_ACC=CAM_ASM_000346 /LENGTH=73 /DNA_ID=CAMNT_0039698893 /DNA_START=264 /DNA_END=485 /DNA_ORIENTATION=+